LEASTGIEPVWTDLQSREPSNKNNRIGENPYQDKCGTAGERDTSHLTTKNAASAATDNGAKCNTKAYNSRKDTTPKRGRSAMAMYGKPDHKRVAKSLGYVLNQGTTSAWHGLTIILMARLTDAERAALAFATLNSLSDDQAYMTASVALFGVLDAEVLV
jgi:hypothetical protein